MSNTPTPNWWAKELTPTCKLYRPYVTKKTAENLAKKYGGEVITTTYTAFPISRTLAFTANKNPGTPAETFTIWAGDDAKDLDLIITLDSKKVAIETLKSLSSFYHWTELRN